MISNDYLTFSLTLSNIFHKIIEWFNAHDPIDNEFAIDANQYKQSMADTISKLKDHEFEQPQFEEWHTKLEKYNE